ncbi:DUF1269 domain-containing protein [Desulfovibrio cuneatus]|uniref:DUF1269 domain-containing protein n=1 Tax=Desulfovibrio cuneatus TaxID=159728 RepID=UPI0004226554|nr:DUF1269 domain-containing protein [Desulfovibrio cuneatus]
MAAQLIVVAYPDMFKAEEVRLTLMKLQKSYLIDMEDAVVVTKDAKGKIALNQINNLTTAGAVSGGFWGLLIGLLFMNPLLGAAVGASTGAVSGALSDVGINDNFMKELAGHLEPETSALFILVRSVTLDKVLPEIEPFGGKVLQSSLTQEDEAKLQAALNSGK